MKRHAKCCQAILAKAVLKASARTCSEALQMKFLAGSGRGFILALSLVAQAVAHTPAELPAPDRDLSTLARQMPDCKEFRNACQVCVRLADDELQCSNIGIACSPSGEWKCSSPKGTDEPKK
jgi:hypothetical protein